MKPMHYSFQITWVSDLMNETNRLQEDFDRNYDFPQQTYLFLKTGLVF